MLSIDVTDACDLSCLYCNNPLFPKPRTFMSQEVFEALILQLTKHPVHRIRIGGGEPTLHPEIFPILKTLSTKTRFLNVITNAQWQDDTVAEQLLMSGVDLIEISVETGGINYYEKSRPGASYKTLLSNLRKLWQEKQKQKSKAIIQVRLMLRPSTFHLRDLEATHFLRYCNTIQFQKILKHPESEYKDDVFGHQETAPGTFRCPLPFIDLEIRPEGRIPICPARGCSIHPEKNIYLGNILEDDIIDLWKSQKLQELRACYLSSTPIWPDICQDCHYH